MKQSIYFLLCIIILFVNKSLEAQTLETQHLPKKRSKKVTISMGAGYDRYQNFGEVTSIDDDFPKKIKLQGNIQQIDVQYHLTDRRHLALSLSRMQYETQIKHTTTRLDWDFSLYPFIIFPTNKSRTTTVDVEEKSRSSILTYKWLWGKKQKVFWGTVGVGYLTMDRMTRLKESGETARRRTAEMTLPFGTVGTELQIPLFEYFQVGVKSQLAFGMEDSGIARFSMIPSIGISF